VTVDTIATYPSSPQVNRYATVAISRNPTSWLIRQ
jgi:hypothetical protein